MFGLGPIQVERVPTIQNGGAAAEAESSKKWTIEEDGRRLTLTKVTSAEMQAIPGTVAQSQYDSIVLENCEISVADIVSLPFASSVKSIKFKNAYNIREWEHLGDLPQLETIIISEAKIDSQALGRIKDLKLKMLALQECPFIKQTDFFTALAPTLKTLILDSCANIKSLAFLKGLNLEALGLRGVAGSEEEDFDAIASNQNLQSLTLVNYHLLDNLDFVASLKLLTLRVDRCVQLVDIGPVAGLKKTLKTLSFAGCSALVSKRKWVENLKIPDTIPPSERFSHRRESSINSIPPNSEIFEIF